MSAGAGAAAAAARRLWPVYEMYHAVTYFAPESAQAYRDLGLKGGWMGYFASRSAPMGPVPAALVTAVFFNFHPSMAARALPDAWGLASPEAVLATRLEAVDAALRRLLLEWAGPDAPRAADTAEAAGLARLAAEAAPVAGRPLYAALRSRPWPEEDHLALWHAATLLREHRGDGHVAVLTAEGLDGCEAHITVAATGNVPRQVLQANRKWSDEDWEAAETRLVERGWLAAAGSASPVPTEQGRAARQRIEDRTDVLAAEPWRALGPERTDRLDQLMRPMARAVAERGGVPSSNPIGVPAP